MGSSGYPSCMLMLCATWVMGSAGIDKGTTGKVSSNMSWLTDFSPNVFAAYGWDDWNLTLYAFNPSANVVSFSILTGKSQIWLAGATSPWPPISNGWPDAACVFHRAERWQRVLLFGGKAKEIFLGDSWAFDPASALWAKVSSHGPSPRARPAAAVDQQPGAFYIFGGSDPYFPWLKDFWLLNISSVGVQSITATWVSLSGGPSKRHSAGMAITGRQLYVFGGDNGSPKLADLWNFDMATQAWSQIILSNGPAGRSSYGCAPNFGAWDATGALLLGPSYPSTTDLWEIDGANCTELLSSGSGVTSATSALFVSQRQARVYLVQEAGMFFAQLNSTTCQAAVTCPGGSFYQPSPAGAELNFASCCQEYPSECDDVFKSSDPATRDEWARGCQEACRHLALDPLKVCWRATWLSHAPTSRQGPLLPACEASDEHFYQETSLEGSGSWCMDPCGPVVNGTGGINLWSSFRARATHFAQKQDCDQNEVWVRNMPGCADIALYDVAGANATQSCAASCTDSNLGVPSLQCFVQTQGYTSSRLQTVCFKSRVATAMTELGGAARFGIMLAYAANSVAWAWTGQVHVEQQRPEKHWQHWGHATIRPNFPLSCVVDRISAKNAARINIVQSMVSMMVDKVSDVGSILAYLSEGQVYYAAFLVLAISIHLDPFQVRGQRGLRGSMHVGYLTEDLLNDRVRESYFEGIFGVVVPALALIFIGRSNRGKPAGNSMFQLGFSMASSAFGVFSLAESQLLSRALQRLGANDHVLQCALIREMAKRGLLWVKLDLVLRVLALIPLVAIAASKVRAFGSYQQVLAIVGVLSSISLVPYAPLFDMVVDGSAKTIYSRWLQRLSSIITVLASLAVCVASICCGLAFSGTVVHVDGNDATPATWGEFGGLSLTHNLAWQGRLLVESLLAAGAVCSVLSVPVSVKAALAGEAISDFLETLDGESWGAVYFAEYHEWLQVDTMWHFKVPAFGVSVQETLHNEQEPPNVGRIFQAYQAVRQSDPPFAESGGPGRGSRDLASTPAV